MGRGGSHSLRAELPARGPADLRFRWFGLLGRFAQARAKDERKTEAQIRSEFAAMGALMTRTLFSAQPNANPNVEAVATAVSYHKPRAARALPAVVATPVAVAATSALNRFRANTRRLNE